MATLLGAIGVPHYTKDGKLYTGEMHKDASGRLMSGKFHTPNSQFLFHTRNGIGAINKNVRTIDLFIEGESKVNLIKRTPTLRDLFTASQLAELKDGKNRLRVNNYVYSKLQNFDFMYVKKID